MKNLGTAELEIMQIIWEAKEDVGSKYVLSKLSSSRPWKLSTLMTSLNRLVQKGFLVMEKVDGTNLYHAVISEDDYKEEASRDFLDKLFGNSLKNLVTAFYDSKQVDEEELKELAEWIDEKLRE